MNIIYVFLWKKLLTNIIFSVSLNNFSAFSLLCRVCGVTLVGWGECDIRENISHNVLTVGNIKQEKIISEYKESAADHSK